MEMVRRCGDSSAQDLNRSSNSQTVAVVTLSSPPGMRDGKRMHNISDALHRSARTATAAADPTSNTHRWHIVIAIVATVVPPLSIIVGVAINSHWRYVSALKDYRAERRRSGYAQRRG